MKIIQPGGERGALSGAAMARAGNPAVYGLLRATLCFVRHSAFL